MIFRMGLADFGEMVPGGLAARSVVFSTLGWVVKFRELMGGVGIRVNCLNPIHTIASDIVLVSWGMDRPSTPHLCFRSSSLLQGTKSFLHMVSSIEDEHSN